MKGKPIHTVSADVSNLQSLTWPASRLGEAIEYLALRSGLLRQSPVEVSALPEDLGQADEERHGHWIAFIASRLGLEAEPIQTSYAEVSQLVRGAAPAILHISGRPGSNESHFLALLKRGRWRISLLGPDLSVHWIPPEVVRDAMCAEVEVPFVASINQVLERAGVPEHRQADARRAILDEQLGPVQMSGCWFLRLSPGADLWRQSRQVHLPRTMLVLFGAYVAQMSLTIVAWWIIGQSVLTGHFDWAWSLGWALILLTAIAFQMLSTAAQNQLSMNAGALFKQRLLYGSLQLELEEIRHLGAGQFLERVMESEAVEQLALGGGFVAVLALIQLGTATVLLALGGGGWPHALLLVIWVIITLGLCWRYLQKSHAWIDVYRAMTNDLVERMVGHRTRLAQEDRDHWHDEEDQALSRYVELSKTLDHNGAFLRTFVPRGWPIVGLAGMASVFLVTQGSLTPLVISLGGVLLALQALTQLVTGMQSIVGVSLAWKEVKPLFEAAARATEMRPLDVVPLSEHPNSALETPPVVTARGLSFSYDGQGRQVLQGCDLQIRYGNRLLLEGPSGGGKSTLAALLAGLRTTESGILLLWGYDQQTIGTVEWRRRVAVVPQFHENHVLAGTFAFNLLMGRRWPPRPEDLAEAEAVCRELGLGNLLDRMPAGIQQMVGESGWQLSHGERSRLYIARALLQQADVLILDESFGALDPENLQRALYCVLRRAPTLLVIAHP